MIADQIRNLLPYAIRTRPADHDDYWFRLKGQESSAGIDVTVDTALQVSVVFACVRLLSEVIGSLPCILHEWLDDGENKKRARDHPLYTVLHDQPNHWQTSQEFFEMGVAHVNLRGNFYCRIVRGQRPPFAPVGELIPLNPDRMAVKDTGEGVAYEYNDPRGKETFAQEEIFHVRGLSFNGLTGVTPLEYARNAIGLAVAQQEHGAALFRNGSVPPYYIKRPPGVKFSDPAKDNFRNSWRGMHGGSKNAHNPPIMEDGMTLEALGINNKDSQWIESQGFEAEEICRFFGVQPHLVGILDKATFSNIEHQGAEFLMYTLGPWLVRFAKAIRRDLIDEKDRYFAEFLTDALLRGDIKSRYEAYALGIQSGFLTRNEVRQKENFNPLDGADELLEPLNMAPAGTRDEGAAVPPVPPEPPQAVDLGPVIADAAGRLVAKEIRILETRADLAAEDRHRWWEWCQEQLEGHRTYMTKVLGPLVDLCNWAEPSLICQRWVGVIHSELLDTVVHTEDIPGLVDDWKANRAAKLTEQLKGWLSCTTESSKP